MTEIGAATLETMSQGWYENRRGTTEWPQSF